MTNIEAVKSIIMKNYSFIDKNTSIFIFNMIPQKKLMSAIMSYANDADPKDAVLLFDDTVFGSAKVGLLLTVDKIYSKESFEHPKIFDLDKIKDVKIESSMMKKSLYVNGFELYSPATIDKKSLFGISLIIKNIAEIYSENIYSDEYRINNNTNEDTDELM